VKPVIVVHGGAGAWRPERETELRRGVEEAARAGYELLSRGEAALEAVVRAVEVLEDNPEFNAGKGAVPRADGICQLDASVFDATTLRYGAVAAVPGVKNPVRLARAVVDSENVFLVGEGALALARERSLALVGPEYFAKTPSGGDTGGAVAFDSLGNLAVAASTGGIRGKPSGRVGDTPLLGAGIFAEAGLGAAAATGVGEALARALVSARAVAGLPGYSPAHAGELALAQVTRASGEGGLIILNWRGEFAAVKTAQAIAWAAAGEAGIVSGYP
jgi:beta-aspartyl-peptidase (threonine type)